MKQIEKQIMTCRVGFIVECQTIQLFGSLTGH